MAVGTEHEWMTTRELAEEVRVPLDTIYKWRANGDGPPATRIGRHLRYRRVAVERWLAERTDPRPAA